MWSGLPTSPFGWSAWSWASPFAFAGLRHGGVSRCWVLPGIIGVHVRVVLTFLRWAVTRLLGHPRSRWSGHLSRCLWAVFLVVWPAASVFDPSPWRWAVRVVFGPAASLLALSCCHKAGDAILWPFRLVVGPFASCFGCWGRGLVVQVMLSSFALSVGRSGLALAARVLRPCCWAVRVDVGLFALSFGP